MLGRITLDDYSSLLFDSKEKHYDVLEWYPGIVERNGKEEQAAL